MTCKNQDDEVYLSLMNQRTQHDKDMINQYNCINYVKTYPQSLVSMMAPNDRPTFPATQTIDTNISYQLNPTVQSIKMAQGMSNSTNKGAYPPNCGFDRVDRQLLCDQQTPYPYANLDFAYNPTSGSKCINLNQDLNFQYQKK